MVAGIFGGLVDASSWWVSGGAVLCAETRVFLHIELSLAFGRHSGHFNRQVKPVGGQVPLGVCYETGAAGEGPIRKTTKSAMAETVEQCLGSKEYSETSLSILKLS